MMKQKGKLIARDGCDGVRVDITQHIRVADPNHGELLRNRDPGDGVVKHDMNTDVSAVSHLQSVFARLTKRFGGKDLLLEVTIKIFSHRIF